MPTGYTSDVVDGKVTEFSQFALQCARAFGALISMREEPHSALIPETIEPDTSYYDGRLGSLKESLARLERMTPTEASVAQREALQKVLLSRQDYIDRNKAEAERLNRMTQLVLKWKPPTPDHEGLRSFMLDQLRISAPGDYVPPMPRELSAEAWRQDEIAKVQKDISYCTEEREKEIKRAEERSAWLKALRDSLKEYSNVNP